MHAIPEQVSTPSSWAILLIVGMTLVIGFAMLVAIGVALWNRKYAIASLLGVITILAPIGLIFSMLGYTTVRHYTIANHNGTAQIAWDYPRQPSERAAVVLKGVPKVSVNEHQAAEEIQKLIDQADINALMDRFDAPQIVFHNPAAPAATPAMMLLAVADKPIQAGGDQANPLPRKGETNEVKEGTAEGELHDGKGEGAAAKPQAASAKVGETHPTDRPSWLNDPPVRSGDVRREIVVTEEYESAEECYQATDLYLMLKAYERIQQLLGEPYRLGHLPSVSFSGDHIVVDGQLARWGDEPIAWQDSRLYQVSRMGISPEYLRSVIVAKGGIGPSVSAPHEYLEETRRSFGPMKKLYTQIEFTAASDRALLDRAETYFRERQFARVGVGTGSVLGMLTMIWGLLKVDVATDGHYTKRLFLGVPLAIMGILAMIMLSIS